MPTNPHEPPKEPEIDGKVPSYRVRHDAKFWLWAIRLAALVAPLGAALGVFALMAVVILVVLLRLPHPPACFEAWPMVILGGILIGELAVVKRVLDRSNRIRAVHHRIALKSLNKVHAMKPKLTLRDLFWLTLVCGCLCGWWVDRSSVAQRVQRGRDEVLESRSREAAMEDALKVLSEDDWHAVMRRQLENLAPQYRKH